MNCPHCGCNLEVTLTLVSGPVQIPTGFKSRAEFRTATAVSTDDLGELLGMVNVDSLDQKSIEFVQQTQARYAQYGDRTRMSEKQMKWLRELAAPEKSEDAW